MKGKPCRICSGTDFVGGLCATPEKHSPEALSQDAWLYRNEVVRVKERLSISSEAHRVSRTVTSNFADGRRFVITLTDDGRTRELSINGVVVPCKGDVDDIFNHLTGHYAFTFDKALNRKMRSVRAGT